MGTTDLNLKQSLASLLEDKVRITDTLKSVKNDLTMKDSEIEKTVIAFLLKLLPDPKQISFLGEECRDVQCSFPRIKCLVREALFPAEKEEMSFGRNDASDGKMSIITSFPSKIIEMINSINDAWTGSAIIEIDKSHSFGVQISLKLFL
ncbi:MAG: hypothetical protein KBB75_00095 [Candidatus Pacebacteria bacterium]|jgi:hypothetical protein|nr:hypothetical protein [Candidatus Paceibacterota bacterium]